MVYRLTYGRKWFTVEWVLWLQLDNEWDLNNKRLCCRCTAHGIYFLIIFLSWIIGCHYS
jgi:hypothetical protein